VLAPALRSPVAVAFVHEYAKYSTVLSEEEYAQLVSEAAASSFESVRERLPSAPEPAMKLVAAGSPAAGLHNLAEREHASLVVIGSSHRSRIGRIVPGGTGERLLSGSPSPVAIAPAGYAASEPRLRSVGCGFDDSQESRVALAWATALARGASAQLRVLSVHEQAPPALLSVGGAPPTVPLNAELHRQLAEANAEVVAGLDSDLDASGDLLEGRAADTLARESGTLDLLVLGSRGFGPLGAVLLGSVSSTVVRSAKSPLVMVPRRASARDQRGSA